MGYDVHNNHTTLTRMRNNYVQKRKWQRWLYRNNLLCSYSANCFFPFIVGDFVFIMIGVTGYLLNRFYISSYSFPFFTNHFNDLLAGIIFPAYINILLALHRKRLKGYIIPLIIILIAGLFWEYVTPLYRHCISDPKDIVAYVAGTFVYCTSIKLFDKRIKRIVDPNKQETVQINAKNE